MTRATSGPMSPRPFAFFDRESSSARTFEATFDSGSIPSSPTLPPWGLMRNGALFERPTPAPLTAGRGSGSLPGTPKVGGRGNLEDHLTTLLPTPRASDGPKGGPGQRNGRGKADSLPAIAALLPTPMTSYSQRDPEQWRDGRPAGNGQRREAIGDLEIVAKLLPTPRAQNGENRNNRVWARPLDQPQNLENALARDFGPYTAAIQRWEQVIGVPAPAPTIDVDGKPWLNPAFVEWMQGLPEGWVTGVEGVSHSAALKMLGNGVVPLQALLALSLLDEDAT